MVTKSAGGGGEHWEEGGKGSLWLHEPPPPAHPFDTSRLGASPRSPLPELSRASRAKPGPPIVTWGPASQQGLIGVICMLCSHWLDLRTLRGHTPIGGSI